MNDLRDLGDIVRRLENIVRLGTVHSVDYAKARCRVALGGIITTDLPWLTVRAGTDVTWDAPTVGEQCLVVAPSGELAGGVVMMGIYSTAHISPSNAPNVKTRHFEDGAVISYDTNAHSLMAILPSGGTAIITATGGITLNGDTTINGNVSVSKNVKVSGNHSVSGAMSATGNISSSDDVTANGISLRQHKHQEQGDGKPTSGAIM